jgi:hypothetical protein
MGCQPAIQHCARGDKREQAQRDIGIAEVPESALDDSDEDHQDEEYHQPKRGQDAQRVADVQVVVIARGYRHDSGRHHRGEHIG